MFGRDRGFAQRDAQGIHFGDFHGSKIIRIDRYHNYFIGFFHEHRANLLGRINFPIPFPLRSKIFPALQPPKLGGAPRKVRMASSTSATVKPRETI
jgi:hypothetical protein